MSPMNLSPHHSKPVEDLFLQASHSIDDSLLKSTNDSPPTISDISLPLYTISSNSHYDHLSEHTQKSHYSVESNSKVVDCWPIFLKKAASSHARFEKIKKIRAFYEATFSSSIESSVIASTQSGPVLQNIKHSKSRDSSITSNSNRSRRKLNQYPINSDSGILSKIEDELGPLQAKLSELSGEVKALNLIGIGVDFINVGGSTFDNHQPTSCKHASIEFQQHNGDYPEYLHYPECHLHNVASSPYTQQLNFQNINSDFNVFNEGNLNRYNKASILPVQCVNESQAINKLEIITKSRTNNCENSEEHQVCDTSMGLELNAFQSCDESVKILVNVSSQYDENEVQGDGDGIITNSDLLEKKISPCGTDDSCLLNSSKKSRNRNILNTSNVSGFNSVACHYNDRKLPASLFSNPKQTNKIGVMIKKQDSNFIDGMTSAPEEFY